MAEAIRVDGLAQFNRNLRQLDAELPKALRIAMNEAGDVIVGHAVPRIPKRSGRAAKSVRARSTRTAVRVIGGGKRAPYYPWLDFGGKVGKGRSVARPFLKDGRYIYAAYFAHKGEFVDVLQRSLVAVATDAGFEVT